MLLLFISWCSSSSCSLCTLDSLADVLQMSRHSVWCSNGAPSHVGLTQICIAKRRSIRIWGPVMPTLAFWRLRKPCGQTWRSTAFCRLARADAIDASYCLATVGTAESCICEASFKIQHTLLRHRCCWMRQTAGRAARQERWMQRTNKSRCRSETCLRHAFSWLAKHPLPVAKMSASLAPDSGDVLTNKLDCRARAEAAGAAVQQGAQVRCRWRGRLPVRHNPAGYNTS